MQYKVKTRLEHDNKPYVPGALIDLEDDVAAKLVEDGVIEPFTERPKPVPVKSNALTQTPEEKAAARAAKAAKKDGKPADPSNEGNNDSEGEKPLEDMNAAELKEEAAKRELPTSGTKAELIERIKADIANPQPENNDNGDDADDL